MMHTRFKLTVMVWAMSAMSFCSISCRAWFNATTYIKMLGNCGQAMDLGDVSVKAVHFSSNKCHIIQLHFLSGLRFKAATYIKMLGNCDQALDWGVVSRKAVHLTSTWISGWPKIVNSNNIIRLSGLRLQENISVNWTALRY